MLNAHLAEVEYDFRRELHASLASVAQADDAEAWRLLRVLIRRPYTETHAAIREWEQPLSFEVMATAAVYSSWSGKPLWLMPAPDEVVSTADRESADRVLRWMNPGKGDRDGR